MKGSVSTWIWILGSVVAGIMVFTATTAIATNQWQLMGKTKGVREFERLLTKTENVCSEDVGTRDQLRLELPKSVRAIYATRTEGEPPEIVSQLIEDESQSGGQYLCLQGFNKDPVCRPLNCKLNATYLGQPSLKLDLMSRVQRLFSQPENHYFLNIIKTERKRVKVIGGRLLQEQDRPTCGNGILEPGEECESKDDCSQKFGSCSIVQCESCFCQPELDCARCQSGRPRDTSDSLNTDWCQHCSVNETLWQRNCGDGIDNDCDGQIDDNDQGCQ